MEAPPENTSLLPKQNGSRTLCTINRAADTEVPAVRYMPHTCKICHDRKVRCDKTLPTCSSCKKSKLVCQYEDPQPKKRKRRRVETANERLNRYERVLEDNGLLKQSIATPVDKALDLPAPGKARLAHNASPAARSLPAKDLSTGSSFPGRLFADDGKSRYISSSLWRDLDEADMRVASDHEPDPPSKDHKIEIDPLSGSLLGLTHQVQSHRPSYEDGMKLWSVYVQNVEPLCKILHVPTMAESVEAALKCPEDVSSEFECLLFAIHYLAVYSMTDEECLQNFSHPKATMTARYRSAVQMALVNASWLSTTSMQVLQALVLFLIAIRARYDISAYWIFTGAAVRIAQRMGLHRDGESLALPPFEVEMRRRLFWALLPLDGYAGGASGTGIAIPPDSWNTQRPSNINDSQIYPGMTEKPQTQTGATDMLFSLCKAELSNFYNLRGINIHGDGVTVQFKSGAEIEALIDELESTIEVKFLRYCDILEPMHFMTSTMARAAANAARIRNRIPALLGRTLSVEESRDLCRLAYKILDSDSAAHNHQALQPFRWKLESFSLWEALICILTNLAKSDFFTHAERDATWKRLAEAYSNHPEILLAKGALRGAIARVTLNAWNANPPSNSTPEPTFIQMIRTQRNTKLSRTTGSANQADFAAAGGSQISSEEANDLQIDDGGLSLDYDFNIDETDWMFWDTLIRDYSSLQHQ